MQHCYFIAGLDRQSFELLITLREIPALEDHEHHYEAIEVESTLNRIRDECNEFIDGLNEHGGEGFGLELLYHPRNQHAYICELCLVDGPMTRADAIVRLFDIQSTADLYLDELQESTLEVIPFGRGVNWKVEGF